ncbi:MAG: inorganic phosphate transporter, partial [Succinivibrio sp.]|nr:inorganic phosphate transporter [Succinivibrio sp.]
MFEAIVFILVVMLMLLATLDLFVGVSNDAANFLNSAVGTRIAPLFVIMLVASVGVLCGATFSSGMMEVARKGMLFPELFSFEEIMLIFAAVMICDVLLLNLFNSFGLPTSTTVSIV